MPSWCNRLITAALLLSFELTVSSALPKRLIVAIDGIAYRDVVALQNQGCFTNFFPVSRLISTFPSASDVAWTEIFGNRALPGYQPTYFNTAANRKISFNALSSTPEYQQQATWRMRSAYRFAMSYLRPVTEFRHELDKMAADFFTNSSASENYYALILSTDSAQHMGADICAMLRSLDCRLDDIRSKYRACEGRDLEILILSDHANNHAGRGQRLQIKRYLKEAGYHIANALQNPRDIVLPTVGIQSWVELHNAPAETMTLMRILSGLKGVDLITARCPDQENTFLVMDSQGRCARIDARPAQFSPLNSEISGSSDLPVLFRYSPETGDPLDYLPVLEMLRGEGRLDQEGFARSRSWMDRTITHRYPVALERIVHGHTRLVQNPATILISLKNGYVHAGWWVHAGSKLMKSGGTHGAVDDLNSAGIIMSNFGVTRDTTSTQVAAEYSDFAGLRDPLAGLPGAEWVSAEGQRLIPISRGAIQWSRHQLAPGRIFLHVWSPLFQQSTPEPPLQLITTEVRLFPAARIRRSDPEPPRPTEVCFFLDEPTLAGDGKSRERLYRVPAGMRLKAGSQYRARVLIGTGANPSLVTSFKFYADAEGKPVPYLTIK